MTRLRLLIVGRLALGAEFLMELNSGLVDVETAQEIGAAWQKLGRQPADILLTALDLPDGSSLDALGEWAKACPLIVVAPAAALRERIRAFELGAEDFVTLPVTGREMAVRMEKALRRWRRKNPESVVRFCDFALDPGARVLRREGRGEVSLSASERSLLELLLARAEKPASRREIARHCLKNTFHETSRAPDMLASKLRAKLRQLGEEGRLETLRGEGYRLRTGGHTRPLDPASAREFARRETKPFPKKGAEPRHVNEAAG